jgi:hypothetical protein
MRGFFIPPRNGTYQFSATVDDYGYVRGSGKVGGEAGCQTSAVTDTDVSGG